jgi:hypothetical protein
MESKVINDISPQPEHDFNRRLVAKRTMDFNQLIKNEKALEQKNSPTLYIKQAISNVPSVDTNDTKVDRPTKSDTYEPV